MAATEFSFDIVSKVDQMEVKNAAGQAEKELANRYDLKGTPAKMELVDKEIQLTAADEFQLEQVRDIVITKLQRRGIAYKIIVQDKIEPGAGVTVRQKLTFKNGIAQDEAKALVKQIKASGVKANAQIQGEAVRVSSKVKDDLQKVMQLVKGLDLPYDPAFENLR
ncbi:MAG: YajQ family cyclic di-GMP-binding protein [Fimbriimonadaceae bacterium]|nr:YajQ family cyclic di-GMP-binding protein [Fimbriimonadaceae bacterium]